MNINDYIAFETRRQSGTMAEAAGMARAWAFLVEIELMTTYVISDVAHTINGMGGYRQLPAVFNQGSPAANAQSIPRLMDTLIETINEWNHTPLLDDDAIEALTKEFLDIHPFADGNGRVASLLRNWMKGTLHNPEIMPYYYGGNNG